MLNVVLQFKCKTLFDNFELLNWINKEACKRTRMKFFGGVWKYLFMQSHSYLDAEKSKQINNLIQTSERS